jgi:hypothetical protein
MKYIKILLFSAAIMTSTLAANAATKTITLKHNKQPVEKVVDDLWRQTQFSPDFASSKIEVNSNVKEQEISVKLSKKDFTSAMLELCQQSKLGFNFGNISYMQFDATKFPVVWHQPFLGGYFIFLHKDDKAQFGFFTFSKDNDKERFAYQSTIEALTINGQELQKVKYPTIYESRSGNMSKFGGLLCTKEPFLFTSNTANIKGTMKLVKKDSLGTLTLPQTTGKASGMGYNIELKSIFDATSGKTQLTLIVNPTKKLLPSTTPHVILDLVEQGKEPRYWKQFDNLQVKNGVLQQTVVAYDKPEKLKSKSLRIRVEERSISIHPIDLKNIK